MKALEAELGLKLFNRERQRLVITEADAFSIIELTRALENIPFKPATLSGSGLFGDRGVRSRTVVIESREGRCR